MLHEKTESHLKLLEVEATALVELLQKIESHLTNPNDLNREQKKYWIERGLEYGETAKNISAIGAVLFEQKDKFPIIEDKENLH